MRLVRISSEEQPTQELNLNAHTVSPTEVGQKPVQLVEIAHQDTEQQPIYEMDTEQQSIVAVTVEQDGQQQQRTHAVNLEQQSSLPITFEQSKLNRSSLVDEQKVVEQKAQEPGALFKVEKQRGHHSYTSFLWWVPLLMIVLLLISVFSGRSTIGAWISHHVIHNQNLTPVVPVIHP